MTGDSVGARLREARTQKRLSLRSLAQSLGVSASLISQVETGKTQPSVQTLYAMATHLDLSLDELLGVPVSGTKFVAPADRSDQAPLNVQRGEDNAILEM